MMNESFSEEQKQYLQGFMAGVIQRGGMSFAGRTADGRITHEPNAAVRDLADSVYGTPVDELCKQERIKLERDPMAMWDVVAANAAAGRFPEGDDVFRYKALGLFYVAPVQDAFMLRCRIPGCLLTAAQLQGLARIAGRYGGGYADVTTRGNIQIREIGAEHPPDVLAALYDIGLTSRGAGADNIRNITASPTSGFDRQELYDVRRLAGGMHHYILNSPDLYGLPRKFNIAFDSGGAISVASDTNDLGFMAVRVDEDVEPGIYFRIELGGVTGHGAFAHDTGYMVRPEQCVAAAAAIIRVYLEHGDRTNRKKARLKYTLDAMGVSAFMREVQHRLAFPLIELERDRCAPRPTVVRHSHIGFHAQRDGRLYAGVVVPVGRIEAEQMLAIAELAERFGSGDVRLTIFQNLLIPDIQEEDADRVSQAIRAAGLDIHTSGVRGGLVACTGNAGCPYATTDTKGHARRLGDYLNARIELEESINIHLTGCPNSCAQHYCGDIGLLGTKVKQGDERVEGYHVVLGGGMDQDQGLAREVARAVPFENIPSLLEHVLSTYRRERAEGESFAGFTRRHDDKALATLFQIPESIQV